MHKPNDLDSMRKAKYTSPIDCPECNYKYVPTKDSPNRCLFCKRKIDDSRRTLSRFV